jgi:hypothetical protein
MPTTIQVQIADQTLRSELDDSATAQAIRAALPLTGTASKWGDEFYFSIPVELAEADDAQAEVAVGALAYWPPGNAFCIFFGPTPVSRGREPRTYSPVNVFGRLLDDISPLRQISNGAPVHVTQG